MTKYAPIAAALATLWPRPATAESPVPPTAHEAPLTEPADALSELLIVRVEMEGGAPIAEAMRDSTIAELRAEEVATTLPEGAPLEVVISPNLQDPGTYDVVYRHRAQEVGRWSCVCSGDEMRFRLGHETVTVWRTLGAEATLVPSSAAQEPAPAKESPRPPRRPRGIGLWAAGISVTSLGVGLVVGAGMALVGAGVYDKQPHPIAIGLTAGGVALTAAGASMWGVGNRRLRVSQLGVAPSLRGRGFTASATLQF